MTALKDYTKLDEKKLNLLHTKSIDKLRELERKKANIEKQIKQETLNKKQIAKAIVGVNDFIKLEDTEGNKGLENLDTETRKRLENELETDMQQGD